MPMSRPAYTPYPFKHDAAVVIVLSNQNDNELEMLHQNKGDQPTDRRPDTRVVRSEASFEVREVDEKIGYVRPLADDFAQIYQVSLTSH